MAKKEEKSKIVLERSYVVPLRREWLKTPKHKRAKKAVTALKEFVKKHMKSENIKIGKHLNDHVWIHGMKNPPHKIKINATKDDKGLVMVEIEGAPLPKEEKKADEKKSEEKKEQPKEEKAEAKTKKDTKEIEKPQKEAVKTEAVSKEDKKPAEKKEELKEEKKLSEEKTEKKEDKKPEDKKGKA